MSYTYGARSPPSSSTGQEQSRSSQSRRSSIASSAASTSRGADPFANAPASWYHPTSPSSSTVSGGSPRSFYSAAQASTLTEDRQPAHWQRQREILQRAASRGSLNAEDDIGDVTIIQNEDGTPQRTSPRDRKGKARESSDDYSESAQLYGQAVLEEDHNGDEEPRDADEESQRIEANLRKWAEKEKLRRAKTRSRYGSPQKQSYGSGSFVLESAGSVTKLVRRMSTTGKRMSQSRPGGHNRTGSRKLRSMSSKDDIFSDGSRLVEVEEVELQPQTYNKSHSTKTSLDSYPQSQPLSATSATFPERIQRAARTGSRFIEDLEDQDVLGSAAGQPQPQTYAQLSSNPATPVGSPTKSAAGTPRSKRKPMLRLADLRTSSIISMRTAGANSPRRAEAGGQLSGQSTPTIRSPTTYTMPKQYYGENTDDLADHLMSPSYKPGNYARQYNLEDDDDIEDSDRQIGWLEWIFCCGCFGSGVKLDDGDEQAGRTFPE